MSKDSQKETALRQLYTELHKFGKNGEYEKAVKVANRILGLAANEEKALHCKIVCLIQVGKFDEALRYIEKNDMKHLVFEKAYCEYRNNLPDVALNTIESAKFTNLPEDLKSLKAQILYRLERFEESYDLYKDIIKNSSDSYDDERQTNLSAVATQLLLDGTKKEVPEFEENTYELTYNNACILAAQDSYVEAEKRLKISEKKCREYLEEDGATEEDIMNELAIIKVQLAYCLQKQGRTKEASALYIDVLKNKPSDPALVAVASNNSVVINKDQNVFDSKKKMRNAMTDACEHKLTSKQKKIIAFNNALLALFANQTDCQALAIKLSSAYPDIKFQCSLIRAAQFAKDKKYKDGIDVMQEYLKKDPKEELAAKFAVVQLHLMNGNRKAAIEVLESLGPEKYRPGVVSALVSLFLGIDNKQRASEILKEAVDWYKKNKSSTSDLSDMWRQAATFHFRGGDPETAAQSLEELLKNNPTDVKILAQLVIAYAKFNPKKAQEVSKRLPALETMTKAAEIDALEATNWTMIAKAVKKTAIKSDQSPGTSGGTDSQKLKKKSKKKRKPKLPKNYDPDVKPDPERWLPKHERTGYKKKRDRRVKEVIKGSQGSASGQADQFDMSKSYNQSKHSPATPMVQETTAGPRQQQRKHQHKKKKGRH